MTNQPDKYPDRGGLAAALVLLALAALVPAGPAQAQNVILKALPEGSKLLVRWFPVPGAEIYNLDAFAGSRSVADESGLTQDTSYTFTLTPGTQYRIQVQAFDSNGDVISGGTGEATGTPLLPPVTGLSITPAEVTGQPSGTVLKATWDAVPRAGYYDVQWRTDGSGWPNTQERPTNSSHIITGLTAGTTYAVRVRAVNDVSGALSVWTIGTAVPSTQAPTDLTASSIGSSGSVRLVWDAPTITGKTVKHYAIKYWSGSVEDPDDFGGKGTFLNEPGSTVDGLRPGTKYNFQVRAEFTDGTRSGYSNTATWTTPAASGAPSRPASVTATVAGQEDISVSWSAPTGQAVTGYDVEFQTPDSSGAWTAVPVLKRTVKNDAGEDVEEDVVNPVTSILTVYGHGGLSENTRYRYRVRAKNQSSDSAWRESAWVTTDTYAAIAFRHEFSDQEVPMVFAEFSEDGDDDDSDTPRMVVRFIDGMGMPETFTDTVHGIPVDDYIRIDVSPNPVQVEGLTGVYVTKEFVMLMPEAYAPGGSAPHGPYDYTLTHNGGTPSSLQYDSQTRHLRSISNSEFPRAVTVTYTARERSNPQVSVSQTFTLTPCSNRQGAPFPACTGTVASGDGVKGDEGPGDENTQVTSEDFLFNSPLFGETVNGVGPTQSATVGEAFSYTAPEATDQDGDTIAYTAGLEGGGALPGWLGFNAATQTFSGTPTAGDAPAALTVVMRATDDGAVPLTATWSFTLSVSATSLATEEPSVTGQAEEPAATPPTAEAGAALIGKRGGDVTLSGSGTKHAEGSQAALTYSWRIKAASHAELLAGTSWLTNATSATATYSVPRRKHVTDRRALDNGQTIDFELTVTDGDGETHTDVVRMTIRGTTWKVVSLSVADASAKESSGQIGFTVSLSAASRDPVTVAYATSDGTALGGSDYTSASGTLTFQPGETRQTVTVTLLDDAHDEGTETFTLTLSNPSPAKTTKFAQTADATATGSIKNADPLQNAWLSRFGRAVASQTARAVSERLAMPADAGSHVTVAGYRLPLQTDGGQEAGAEARAGGPAGRTTGPPALRSLSSTTLGTGPSTTFGTGPAAAPRGPVSTGRAMSVREILLGSSFHVASTGNGGRWAGWGRAGIESFENRDAGLPVDGDVVTGVFGADWSRGPWLGGVAVSVSRGTGAMRPRGMPLTYDLTSTMAAVTPYLRVALSERVAAWGLAGYGRGDLTLTERRSAPGDAPTGTYTTDLAMTLGALGARGQLLTPGEAHGYGLALKGDAFFVRTTSDAVTAPGLGRLEAADANASRLRLTLEGSRPVTFEQGVALTPSLEVGVRHDGGDAETGAGLEVGGGLLYANPGAGVSADLRARVLVAHAETGYREWGVSGAFRLAPDPAGRGLALTLTPAWGTDPGGADQLWTAPDATALAPATDRGPTPAGRLDAELGYGFPVFGNGYTGTPTLGVGLSNGARSYRLGWRLGLAHPAATAFTLGIDATRSEVAHDRAHHGVLLRVDLSW